MCSGKQLQLPLEEEHLKAELPPIDLSWDEINKDMHVLISNIKREIETKNMKIEDVNIIIPCRGGEIVGSLLKNALGLTEDQIYRVKLSNRRYEDGGIGITLSQEDHYILTNIKGHKFFVDDLIDSGDTIEFIRDLYDSSVYTAVLYAKEGKDSNIADFHSRKLPDAWIVFPWEHFYKK